MSTGNEPLSSSIANITLPQRASTAAAQAGATVASTSVQPSEAYAQQYAAYYQQQLPATADGTSTATAAYNAALYQQYYANYAQQQYAAYYQQQQQIGAYPVLATNPIIAAAAAVNSSTSQTSADDGEEEEEDPTVVKPGKAANTLPYHCNSKMGLNPLIYTNIQQSPYFKNNLFQLKTYHEVIDEIYYNVKHLEPWEKGSRKVSGQTGMCGSVRGVGAGGIISTPFCLLFKLYTLRLTRKQVNGLIRHKDSPFIRGLGFMFIRFTQPPQDLWKWFEPFLSDEEEVDPKAGGGAPMTIGEMVRILLTKPDWFSTLFPRIPIPIQKDIDEKLRKYDEENPDNASKGQGDWRGADERVDKADGYYNNNSKHRSDNGKYSRGKHSRSRSRSRSPPGRYHDKRPKKYDDDDRRSDYDRSNRNHKSNRYH